MGKELFSKIKEWSDLLESEKQRADVNNDLLNQRCKEVEELKTSLSLEEEQCRCWKGSANSLGEKLDKAVSENNELQAKLKKARECSRVAILDRADIESQVTGKPNYYTIEQDDESAACRLFAEYDAVTVLIKTFATEDKDYNLGLAIELKEKLEETI